MLMTSPQSRIVPLRTLGALPCRLRGSLSESRISVASVQSLGPNSTIFNVASISGSDRVIERYLS